MNLKMTDSRRTQLDLVAAKYGMSADEYLNAVINSALVVEASQDPAVRLMLAKIGGASWKAIEQLVHDGE